MGIIVMLILISITIAAVFLGIFYWNIRSGQYDDTYTPSVRILFDDETKGKREDAAEERQKTDKSADGVTDLPA